MLKLLRTIEREGKEIRKNKERSGGRQKTDHPGESDNVILIKENRNAACKEDNTANNDPFGKAERHETAGKLSQARQKGAGLESRRHIAVSMALQGRTGFRGAARKDQNRCERLVFVRSREVYRPYTREKREGTSTLQKKQKKKRRGGKKARAKVIQGE